MTLPVLGVKVRQLDVVLDGAGGSFTAGLRRSDGSSWAIGDVVEMRFSDGTTWTAVLTGDLASWSESQAAVAALVLAAPSTVAVWYINGLPVRWTRGCVTIQS